MPLLPAGTRLGSFEILAPIGAGGMGEVYRARDTRLDRDVAKILAVHVAREPHGHERFEREARPASRLKPGCAEDAVVNVAVSLLAESTR
jgi:eukaryotic-like serine/threonine-protein kinase